MAADDLDTAHRSIALTEEALHRRKCRNTIAKDPDVVVMTIRHNGRFSTEIFERYQRSGKAWLSALPFRNFH